MPLAPLTADANNFTSSAEETDDTDDASYPVACRTGCHVGDGLHHHGRHARIHPAHEHALCKDAGGTYTDGTCHASDNIRTAQQLCEARGGVYFDGGDYCEVSAIWKQ